MEKVLRTRSGLDSGGTMGETIEVNATWGINRT